MDGLDAEQLTAAERRSEPGAGVALRVARLAGTPSKSRSSEHGRLRARELWSAGRSAGTIWAWRQP